MKTRSLSTRLFACFVAVLLGLWLVMLAGMLVDAAGANRERQERELGVFARLALQSLAPDAHSGQLVPRAGSFMALEGEMREVYYADCAGPITMQVWQDGALVFDRGGPPGVAPPPGVARLDHGGNRWLTATARDAATGLVVRMGTVDTVGFLLRKSNLTYIFMPLVLCMPFLLVPLWIAVRVGIRPVRRMIDELHARETADLAPVETPRYRELQPLAAAINSLMARLSERIARERDLLADAAHELKTPMAIIQANADNLLNARDDAQRERAHRGLVQGVRRGAHAVHQLLSYARSGANTDDLRQEVADLSDMLVDRVASFATVGLARGIDVELQCQPGVLLPLHRESMVAVVDNILDNAMKYGPAGSSVFISLAANADGTTLEVTDQGPGIAPGLRDKVFERFYRIPGSAATGSGLGLAIARRALRHNGGSIALDGATGGGLRVVITLPPPLRAAPEVGAVRPRVDAPASAPAA